MYVFIKILIKFSFCAYLVIFQSHFLKVFMTFKKQKQPCVVQWCGCQTTTKCTRASQQYLYHVFNNHVVFSIDGGK